LDPTSKNYGKYDYVYIVDEIRGKDIKVHWSRFILWLGMELPREEMFANGGFGDSRLNHLVDTILNLTNAYNDTRQVIKTVYQDIFKTQALADMLDSNNPDGRTLLKSRMSLIDESKASRNTLIADVSEVFERLTINCSGIRDLVEVLQVALSSQTTIPVTKLFGLTSGGLNATKEQEQKNYYDVISSRQNNELLEKVEQLKEDICSYTGIDNQLMVISFPPLMQQTELEKAEMRKMHAETDNIYILNGTLNSEEVRLSRFGGERYSDDISLIEDSLVMQREANSSEVNPLPSNVKGMANNTDMEIKKPKKEKIVKQVPIPKPTVDVKA
jgi:hypothetical protein